MGVQRFRFVRESLVTQFYDCNLNLALTRNLVAMVHMACAQSQLEGVVSPIQTQLAKINSASTPLTRFELSLPTKPFCGDDKLAQLIRNKAHAVKYPYIQFNSPAMAHWLVLDLDYDDLPEDKFKQPDARTTLFSMLESNTLPCPNFAVFNPSGRSCHIYFSIQSVCTSRNGSAQAKSYFKAVKRGLNLIFKGDLDYSHRIAKNPMCPHWRTEIFHNSTYSLGELYDYVDDSYLSTPEEAPEGRNCTLFLQLRMWAYREVTQYRKHSNYDIWHAEVERVAEGLNRFRSEGRNNLPWPEVRDIAKSVASWTWDRYTGSKVNRGVMGFTTADGSLRERQRLAARRTHVSRRDKTIKRIEQAVQGLLKRKERVTKAAVARLANISRQHLSTKYRAVFDAALNPESAQIISLNSVLNGVHQILADREAGVDPVIGGSNTVVSSNVVDLRLSVPRPMGNPKDKDPPDSG